MFEVLRIEHWVCGQRIRCDNYNFSIFVKSKTMLVIPNETIFQTLEQKKKQKKNKKKSTTVISKKRIKGEKKPYKIIIAF